MRYRAPEKSWEARAHQLQRRVNELEKEKEQFLRKLRPFECVVRGPDVDINGEPKRWGVWVFDQPGPQLGAVFKLPFVGGLKNSKVNVLITKIENIKSFVPTVFVERIAEG